MIELFAATSRINGCQPLTLLGALSALGLMAFIGGVVWTGGALWFGDKDGMTPGPESQQAREVRLPLWRPGS